MLKIVDHLCDLNLILPVNASFVQIDGVILRLGKIREAVDGFCRRGKSDARDETTRIS